MQNEIAKKENSKKMNPITQQLQYLQPLSDKINIALDDLIKHKTMAKGQLLLRIGQKAEYFYFLNRGLARVFYKRNGKDITDYFAIDQQFIGAVPSLFNGQPSHKAIETLEDSDIYYFSYPAFEQLCTQHHALEHIARKQAVLGMLQGQQRIESIRFLSAKERYHELEKLYPGITNRAPLKHIASYLGTTQVSISRIRAGKQ